MGFANVAALETARKRHINSVFTLSQTGGTRWISLWTTTGITSPYPPRGSTPGTGAGEAVNNTTEGALNKYQMDDAPAGKNWHLARAYIHSRSGSTFESGGMVWVLYDRLVQTSGLVGNITTLQTVNSAALSRYTSGEDVQAFLEIYSALGATTTTATVIYTNQAGTGSRSGTVHIPASVGAATLLPMNLDTGDTGVRSVESVQLAASTGTAGNFGVTLMKPLSAFTSRGADGGEEKVHDWMDLALPKIENDSCLHLVYGYDGVSNFEVIVELEFAAG